jgi:hypothetical protein
MRQFPPYCPKARSNSVTGDGVPKPLISATIFRSTLFGRNGLFCTKIGVEAQAFVYKDVRIIRDRPSTFDKRA